MNELEYFISVLLLFVVFFIGGCTAYKTAEAKSEPEFTNRLVCVEKVSENMTIWKDKSTGVHYLLYDKEKWQNYGYAGGLGISSSICVMVDANGKPLI